MFQRVRRSRAGFSLAEVLVALAVASILVTKLTEFVINTRNNGVRAREAVEMSALSQSLLANIKPENLNPGTSSGRKGGFAWHIDVTAIPFTAFSLRMNENKAAYASPAGTISMVPAGPNTPAGKNQVVYNGVPFHIGLVISAPSGSKYRVDTMRMRFDKTN
jgi:prepilin-type N-terminal cleavage/methylation domain-containing protein